MKKIYTLLILVISIANASEYIEFKDIEIKKINEARFIDLKKELIKVTMDHCYLEQESILCLKGRTTYASKLDGFKKDGSLFLNSPLIKLEKLDLKGF
jgi:hypothetical protein